METPPPQPPQPPFNYTSPSTPLDIGRCLNESLAVYQKNIFILVLAAVIFHGLSLVSLTVLTGPVWGGIYVMTIAALTSPDKKIDINLMFSQFGRFGPLLGLFLLTVIPTLFGFALLIVPGVLLMTLWMYSFPLLIERNMSITQA